MASKDGRPFPGEDAGLYARTIDVDARDAESLHKLRQAGSWDLGKLLASDKVDHIHVDAGKGGDTVAEGVALNSYRYTDLLGKKASEAWTLKGIQVAHGSKGPSRPVKGCAHHQGFGQYTCVEFDRHGPC